MLATNVEFWSAVVLDFAEVPPDLFTPMFTCARTAGWSAHILEQKREARLIRPTAKYVGPPSSPAFGPDRLSESRRRQHRAPGLTVSSGSAPLSRMNLERQLDPEALGDHIDRLYRAAWSLCGSREEAEDLVQETFARILRKPRMLRSEDDLGYLLRVLRNTFFSQRRTAGRRPQTQPLPDDLDLIEDRSATQPESRIESQALYNAISELPDDFRDALVAIDVVGLSYREAARALRVREATITTRLHRARQRVARRAAGRRRRLVV